MRLIRRSASTDALDALARAYQDASLASEGSDTRPRRSFARDESVGQGAASFDRLVDSLLRWDVHREAGLSVGSTGPVSLGSSVALVKWFGPVGVLAPCRVIEVVDEPHRRGFVYAALPDHPEQGEERFTVLLADVGEVRFRVEAWSRPAGFLPRLGRPVAEALQDRVTKAYLAAAQRLASD